MLIVGLIAFLRIILAQSFVDTSFNHRHIFREIICTNSSNDLQKKKGPFCLFVKKMLFDRPLSEKRTQTTQDPR